MIEVCKIIHFLANRRMTVGYMARPWRLSVVCL